MGDAMAEEDGHDDHDDQKEGDALDHGLQPEPGKGGAVFDLGPGTRKGAAGQARDQAAFLPHRHQPDLVPEERFHLGHQMRHAIRQTQLGQRSGGHARGRRYGIAGLLQRWRTAGQCIGKVNRHIGDTLVAAMDLTGFAGVDVTLREHPDAWATYRRDL